MPVKTHPFTSNFSSGEWSDKLEGRIDLEGYANSAHEITNWIITTPGGLITRGGWHFVAEIKDSSKEARLIPFQFSELQNYIIEIGDEYMRFCANCGQVVIGDDPYEIFSPYFDDEIWEIRYAQDDMNLYLVHPDVQRQKLTRISAFIWAIETLESLDGPYMDEITDIKITPSATTGNINLSATTSFPNICTGGIPTALNYYYAFYPALAFDGDISPTSMWHSLDVLPNYLRYQLPTAAIGKKYTIRIRSDITSQAPKDFKLQGSNNGTSWTDLDTQTGITWVLGEEKTFTFINTTAYLYYQLYVTAVISPPYLSIVEFCVYGEADVFLDGHIGSVFRIRHSTTWGRVQINSVTDKLNATGTVLTTLGGVGASDGYMESCWSDQNGYPRVLNFHEGRIQYASTYEQPQTIWASQTFQDNIFTPGTDDDSPYSLTLKSQRIIRWLKTTRRLCIGSMSGESTAIGPNDAALSCTDPPKINDETTHGSASLDCIRINKAILFLQQSERKIREFSYNYTDDAYSAPDITVRAEHMFEQGIIDSAYQQEPYSILWVITGDAILRGCTYNRETNAIGWFTVETDGDVESIAVIPYLGKDQLWAIIRRPIDGGYKRYIEYLDWDISLDSALTYSEGTPITTVGGLLHLKGKIVKAIADGAYEGEHTVSPTGEIVLSSPASQIVVGLPFTPTLVTSRPEVSLPSGSSQGLFKGWAKISLRLIDSMGLTVNGEIIPARSTDDDMGEPPNPYSGDFDVESAGWDRDGRITIVQTSPMLSYIVALFGTLMIGDD